ncbi:MAG: dTMP kinase [Bacteroidales bacterium]|jgi:dTMP kinase|nr:dTMP kinase [Bacteroidales bacterium]
MSFIVLEGLDGSGKTTQIELLSDFFKSKNREVEFFHFPTTDSAIFGDLIARFLRGEFGSLEDVNPYLVALLFAGDRFNLSKKIFTWLNEKKYIITDRYVYSNIAFQGAKFLSEEEQNRISDWIFELEYNYFKIPKPDLSIFLNVPFEFTKNNLLNKRIGNDRNYLQGKEDIHEANLNFQSQVYKLYNNSIEKDDNFIKLDCFDENNKIFDKKIISEKIIELLFDRKLINDLVI